MKRMLFVLMISLSTLRAGDYHESKIWQFFQMGSKAVIITDDYEVWELNFLVKNQQTWGEWIMGSEAEQIPKIQLYLQSKWKPGTVVSVTGRDWEGSREAEYYRESTEHLMLCEHFMENLGNHAKAFARKLDSEGWLKDYKIFKAMSDPIKKPNTDEEKEIVADREHLKKFCNQVKIEQQRELDGFPYAKNYVEFEHYFHFVGQVDECLKVK